MSTIYGNPLLIGGGGKKRVTWHQCPEAVRNYLANVTYDPGDYSTSQIDTYLTNVPTDSYPVGKTVDGVTYYNEIPSKETPFASANVAGTLKPLDSLRMIYAPPVVNVRDLGGWACDGGTVRYGKLYRGGALYASAHDVLVDQCGVRVDLDLRGAAEAGRSSSPLGDDVTFVCPTRIVWYSLADKYTWREILRCIFDNVALGRAVYYHCAAGADRTATVSCIIEAILGVGASDRDKDYELTSFAGSDYLRKRTYASGSNPPNADWVGLISEIDALPGDTTRDKVVNWVASLGFTAAQINAFRTAMIDGTPETVTPSIDTYTVTNTMTNATSDNSDASAVEYQPYTAKITPANGYVISNVRVKMGGVYVTDSVWTGTETVLRHKVTSNLTHCTGDNKKKAVIDRQGYAATLTAADNYTLEGASVTILMGGIDMSEYYKDGVIAIPQVTGDIEITITAVESAQPYTNQIPISTDTDGSIYNGTGYMTGHRINSSGNVATAASGNITADCFVTGFIPVKGGDVIRFRGAYIEGESGGSNNYVYKADRTVTGYVITPYQLAHNYNEVARHFPSLNYDSELMRLYGFTVPDNADAAYMRFTLFGNPTSAVVTINEEIT